MRKSEALLRYERQIAELGRINAFSFATGRVRVLEKDLFSAQQLSDMAQENVSQEEVLALMSQARYPEAETVETRLTLALEDVNRQIKSMTQKGLLARGLLLEQDVHNLKVFLKYLKSQARTTMNEGAGESVDLGLSSNQSEIPPGLSALVFRETIVKAEDLWQAVRAKMAGGQVAPGQDPALLKMAEKEMARWGDDVRLSAIDYHLDQARFHRLLQLCDEAESRLQSTVADEADRASAVFLRAYAECQADLLNFQSFLRVKRLHLGPAELEHNFVAGGRAKLSALKQALEGSTADLRMAVSGTVSAALMDEAVAYLEYGQIAPLSLAVNHVMLDFARMGLSSGMGPAQVGGYFIARQMEAQNLRLILASKETGRQAIDAVRLLRRTYRRTSHAG